MTATTNDPGHDDSAATRIYLLRHGESAVPDVFHGAESDVALSQRGQKQAEAVASVLAEYCPQAVVSSAMRRARETAMPIAFKSGVPLHIIPELHERRVGPLSGKPFAEYDHVWDQTIRSWLAGKTYYAPPGAESLDDLRGRILPAWQDLAERYAGKRLVVVAHGVVCKVILTSLVEGLGLEDWKRMGPIRNTAISELVHNGRLWQAVRINDTPAVVRNLE